jgi:hypothetical protein
MPIARCRCAELTPTEETSMPLTTLDPQTAIIVIDLQKGIVALPTVHPTADVISRSCALANAFRTRLLGIHSRCSLHTRAVTNL